MRIRNEVLVIMIGFLVLLTGSFTVLLYQVQYRAYETGIDNELRTAALMAREILPAGYHDRIRGKDSVADAEYLQIVDRFNRLCVEANLEYLWSLMILDGKVVFTSATSPSKVASNRDQAAFLEVHSNPALYTKAFETMQPQYQINDDKWGRIRTVLLPFYDSQGRKYLVGASRSMRMVDEQMRGTLVSSLLIGGSILLMGVAASILLANSLAGPIEAVTDAASEIAGGKYRQAVEVRGPRELEILESSINSMSSSIQEQMQALAESRENLRITLQSIGDAVIAASADGRVDWMNPLAELLTGWSQEQARNRPLEEVFRIVDSDSEQPPENPVSAALRTGQVMHLEDHTLLIAKGGQEHQIADSAAPIRNKDGEIVGAVLVFRDVTEQYLKDRALRRTTEELENFFTLALDLLCIADTDGYFLRLNRAWYGVLGYTVEELKGCRFLEFVHPDDVPATLEAMKDLSDQKMVLNFVNRYRCKDGSYRWIEWRSYAVENLIYAAARDITERILTEEKIRTLNAELEERVRERTAQLEISNKELEAFAYSVSHDLRAPLRGIDGFSLVLLEEYGDLLDERGQQYLKRVRSAAQHMGRLIEDLLRLSRVARSEMTRSQVDLGQMARRLAAELHETQAERQVEWIIAPDVVVQGDELLLEAAMRNLLSNAFKFTSRHAASRIEFGVLENSSPPVYFVRDDGAGFDMAYGNKIFGVFNRLHSPQAFDGTGVGLAIVQRIIQRHGGKIWAEAAVEQGATFYFTLGK